MAKKTVYTRVANLMNDEKRTLCRPRTASPLEHAWCMAANARDHAKDRFEAMDFCQIALEDLDFVTDYSAQAIVREGPITQAKTKWDL